MVNLLKKNLTFILLLPVIVNCIFNLLKKNISIENINIYDFFSSIFLFLFLFLFGNLFKEIYENLTITFGIIIYLISFFIFESVFLFFYKSVNLDTSFILINIIWLSFFIFKTKNKQYLAYLLISYLFMTYFNNSFNEIMTSNVNIIGDVKDVFLPNVERIYNNSFYESVVDPKMTGYPQFMSYLDALIHKISIGGESYTFFITNSLIFFWLNILLFIELNLERKNRLLLVLIFSLLIINSEWLQFLFVTSLMSERIVGYLFLGILIPLFRQKKLSGEEVNIVFFTLGFIYLTKQFFSTLVIVLFILFFFIKKYRKHSVYLVFAFLIKELSYLTYFKGTPKDHHISQIDFMDTIFDLLLFRDLAFNNINEIISNLFIDKPMSYIILIATFTYFLYLFLVSYRHFELNLYSFLSITNAILVFLLYISVWQNMELESPIRYIYSFLPFYLVVYFYSVENIEKRLKI
tara:strand:- start:394 stop:1785 length:1392 start_codon:yes stop_codon:yes gene_type:complete